LQKAEQKLAVSLEAVRAVLPEELTPAFDQIQKYWDAYLVEATEEARQIQGPGYEESVAKLVIQRAEILDALRKSKSTPLEATEADVTKADEELGEVYTRLKALAQAKPQAAEMIVQIRTTQLAWLLYRKEFAEARYEGAQKAWATATVTRNRTGILTNLESVIQATRGEEPEPPVPPPVVPVPEPGAEPEMPVEPAPKPGNDPSPIVPVPQPGTTPNAAELDYVNVKPLRLSKKAVDHIVKFETGGRSYYESMYQRPQWPGYSSGVTIGFGYDLGYCSKEQIQADWAGVLGPKEITAMLRVQGVTGSAAKSLAAQIKSEVFVSWETAKIVFERSTLPHWSRLTADAYVLGRGELPPDCNGALIGNTFNRGPAISAEGRQREKYLIREAIRLRNWSAVPALFEAQRKYWPGTDGSNGLQTRRSEEAALWKAGLVKMTDGSFPPVTYLLEDISDGKQRSYYRNEVVGPRHPIWRSPELHPAIVESKNRVLGIGREGEQRDTIRAGTLYAASAAAHATEAYGYFLQVTSGNRWGVSTSPNHGQKGDLGDAIDFVVSTKPGGLGARLDGKVGMERTYDILACAANAAAKDLTKPGVGVGWGRSNGAGHHIEVDDGQRGAADVVDVWPYSDSGDSAFLSFERDFGNRSIFNKPEYAKYQGYFQGIFASPTDPATPAAPREPASGAAADEGAAPVPESND
jgi:uncharacterized protein YecT (DUF1311 family)